ncbi:hypothetical protein PMAYCL1PPCAC_13067, partial [Pristionchus mayeri]
MEVMLLAVRFVEIVASLPGLALQVLTVMVLYRTKLFGALLKTFLMLLVLANMWLGIANFISAVVTTIEASTFRFGIVVKNSSSFLDHLHFYVQYQSNHALMVVLMAFTVISIE